MFLIREILVSHEILQHRFVCNLSACLGACCWEGDWGAPVEDYEQTILTNVRESLRPYLTRDGNELIDEQGSYVYYKEPKKMGTPLLANGHCAYLNLDSGGCASCGIETAHRDGAIDFKKPISCHLYPIRHQVESEKSFQALNYDEWDICQPACTLGKTLDLPLYEFAKEAIIRKFGVAFYEDLEAAAAELDTYEK